MIKLPHLPAGFTPEFLSALLHQTGTLPAGSRVAGVDRQRVGDGTGMMAELARLVVTYEGDPGNSPPSFIAKYASQNETNRGIALSYKLYERETRYCAELDPLTTAVTPNVYYAGLEGDRFLLLLEDLIEYDVGSQELGATLRQTELAIDELAKLHGTFWEEVNHLEWVPGIADSYHADNMLQFAHLGWDNMAELFGLPDHIRAQKDSFLAAIPQLQTERMAAPVTLVHGDFRMENLLYGNRPGHHEVAVIDWQGPLKARGMFDLALFLGQSTRSDVRQAHERSLLERYLDGLQDKGVSGIDMDFIWEDYRRCMLYDWVYVAVVAGTLDASNEKAFRWMTQMVNRQVIASDDLHVFDLLPNYR